MSNVYWGEPTWTFFHTLAEKVKEEEYDNIKEELLKIIKQICMNLPCPDCRKHATNHMSRIKIVNVQNKEMLKDMLFTFHNNVNRRTNAEIKSKKILETYKSKDFTDVFINFVRQFSKPIHNHRLMMDSVSRNKLMKSVISCIQDNINSFTC